MAKTVADALDIPFESPQYMTRTRPDVVLEKMSDNTKLLYDDRRWTVDRVNNAFIAKKEKIHTQRYYQFFKSSIEHEEDNYIRNYSQWKDEGQDNMTLE